MDATNGEARSRHPFSGASTQGDMGRPFACDAFHAFVAERRQVQAFEQVLATSKQQWTHGEMQLVDQLCLNVLPHDGDTTAKAYIETACGRARLFQCGMDASGDEMEGGASRHRQRWSRVVSQHEHGDVIRRLLAPPASPAFVGPGAADGAEHVAPEDPCADAFEAALRHGVVHAGFTIVVAVHPLPHACGKEPVHQGHATDAERVVDALVGAGAVAVK